ncbi:MAG TPA: glycerophosphodiester phosphodiesterase [Burkholderiales bacterium]|nr:glycerophosphodiester phosphodiesterase [Burkholderiales bacterium]
MKRLAFLAALAMTAAAPAADPLVIAHRGASGALPEHTLEAYALAIEQGADYVELDLVATKDGHLVARHEPNLATTTDVKDRPEFAGRKRRAVIDGVEEEGWFACDFTLEELKRLRAVQAFPDRPREHDGRYAVPTLEEVIALVKRRGTETGRTVGIYPETKHPTWHRRLGLALEPRLAKALELAGWSRRDAPVFVQSFEPSSLRAMAELSPVRRVQLVGAEGFRPDGSPDFGQPWDWSVSLDPRLRWRGYGDLLTDTGLREVRTWADAIGPWKRLIVNEAGAARGHDLIRRAHRAGLEVHTWTFRSEPRWLAPAYGGDPKLEYLQFYLLGVDGVFSDFPDTAIASGADFRRQ